MLLWQFQSNILFVINFNFQNTYKSFIYIIFHSKTLISARIGYWVCWTKLHCVMAYQCTCMIRQNYYLFSSIEDVSTKSPSTFETYNMPERWSISCCSARASSSSPSTIISFICSLYAFTFT